MRSQTKRKGAAQAPALITGRSRIGRRAFLRGLGAAVALPWLDAMAPSSLRSQARASELTASPKRLLYYYVPNGMRMDAWVPAATGQGDAWSLSPVLAPLAAHKSDLLVLSGLDNYPGGPLGPVCCGAHFQQTASWLTCVPVPHSPMTVGVSVDQIAANAISGAAPFDSLQLGMAAGSTGGTCAGKQWPCPYLGHISWADETTPLSKDVNPKAVFERLFGGAAVGLSPAEIAKRKALQMSVVDTVLADANALKNKLGYSDRLRIDEYIASLDAVETQINALGTTLECAVPSADSFEGSGYVEKLSRMADLMVLAFQCDMTRVITFMTHNAGASHQSAYSWVTHNGAPLTEKFHDVSHHGGNAEKLDKYQAINHWEVQMLAALLDRLAAVETGPDERLLDSTLVFFGSECGDGQAHSVIDMPVILAGGSNWATTPDRHVAYSAPNNIWADLHIGVLERFGVSIPSFGLDGTHPLAGLTA